MIMTVSLCRHDDGYKIGSGPAPLELHGTYYNSYVKSAVSTTIMFLTFLETNMTMTTQ